MRDMQAECLDNRLALLEIHIEVFVNVSSKEFFLIDELLNVLLRLSDLFLAVFLFYCCRRLVFQGLGNLKRLLAVRNPLR